MGVDRALRPTLKENEAVFRQLLQNHRGAIFRRIPLPGTPCEPSPEALLIFFEAQQDDFRLEVSVIRPLIEGDVTREGLPRHVASSTVPMKSFDEALAYLYRGKVLLLWEGSGAVVAVEVAEPPARPITPPDTESGVSGPRESLSELLVINLTMLRRRYPGPDLHLETTWIGKDAQLEAVMCYLEGKPEQRVLDVVRQRLAKLKHDGLQDATELTEALSDSSLTVFPTIMVSERPDIIIHYLKAGRVAVLLDNSPRALIGPVLFMDFLASADDYYEWRPFVAFLRLLRFIAFNIAVPLPALYVAVTTYHLQALPTQLTLSLLAQREGAPLPPPVEAAVMTLMFEILREAGVRLPRAIGPTVSIVGGLVIGDAAIRSGLTSPAMVLVVSATAVATFSLPSVTMANAATYYRFFVLALT
ncbi:MAG TPA: spore germination protein, partial [Symbiobacteriaceae bacterium]|nr:spore germination protein [Symbiobacteriaceae bacterium]